MSEQKGKTFEEQISLTNLELPELDNERLQRIIKESDEEKKRLQEQYGEGWFAVWKRLKGIDRDYDTWMKKINTMIYYGKTYHSGTTCSQAYYLTKQKWENRMHDLYGFLPGSFVTNCPGGYPNAAKLLLEDALRTGKWKELPDELQLEYHKKVKENLA